MAISQTLAEHYKSLGIDPNTTEYKPSNSQLQEPNYGVLGDLGGLYGAFANGGAMSDAYGSAATSAQTQADTLQRQLQQMPTLDSMYGPNSPYAQQLQQSLAAKDAAAGRNSQYGNRAVQLQATLADKGSQYAAQQAQMGNAYTQALDRANTARTQATLGQQQIQAQQLASLFKVGNSTGLLGQANSGLADMYNKMFPSSLPAGQSMADSPYAGGGNYSGYTTGSDGNNIGYQSNGGMGPMAGPAPTNYAPGMDTSQAPTSSGNAYSMDDYLNQ